MKRERWKREGKYTPELPGTEGTPHSLHRLSTLAANTDGQDKMPQSFVFASVHGIKEQDYRSQDCDAGGKDGQQVIDLRQALYEFC